MKKKIILKRIFHRNKWSYAIIFDYDSKLIGLVKLIDGTKWSHTHECWYADCNESVLKQILTVFRECADIDISSIVSAKEKEDLPPEISGVPDKESVPNSEDQVFINSPLPMTIHTIHGENEKDGKYGPVKFTINEADGRLVIKFLGRYAQEWIEELKGFGRYNYDNQRREWLIPWSQLAVDSLSDYFSSRGITVITVKSEVSPVIKEKREKEGSEVRDRILTKASLEGIELIRKYLEEKRYSKRTLEAYISHLELFFKYYNEKDPDDLTEEDISEFVTDHIIRLGYSASYQNIIISAIKMYFSLSGERRLELDSIERPRKSKALPKVFSKEEVMKLFNVTRNNKHKLMLWLIYSCGLRRSEVINIKLNDLDRERGLLHIREGKGKVDRIVPIPQKIWEKIRLYLDGYKPITYLFEGQSGGRYSVESVYSVFKQSLRRAGIRKDVGVHCLRHSYATHLHESGLDIRYIQELLGHKSSRTTEVYTHVSRRNLFAIRSPIEDMDIE